MISVNRSFKKFVVLLTIDLFSYISHYILYVFNKMWEKICETLFQN